MPVERFNLPLKAPGRRRAPAKPAPPTRDRYHHGDLRAALLAAAEDELAEKGVEGFTLRGCARRAGVSHAAPAHHFKDVRGLLTELAVIGFERLARSMADYAAGADPASAEYRRATGQGYVAFAAAYPQLFRLIFRVGLLDRTNERYRAARAAAFAYPVGAIGALYGSDDPMADPDLSPQILAIWSLVHGFSELMLGGQFDASVNGDRSILLERLVPAILDRYMPEGPRRKASKRKEPR